jgi:hypothetical protein
VIENINKELAKTGDSSSPEEECDQAIFQKDGNLAELSSLQEVRKKRKLKGICLTSYPAWWNRIEKEERQFHHEVEKERVEREKKKENRECKKKEKETFIKKFFPTCTNSPGGTQKLVNNNKNSIISKRSVGKLELHECLGNPDAKTANKIIFKK